MKYTKTNISNDAFEINVVQIAAQMWRRKISIIASAIIGSLLFMFYSLFYITPIYQSQIMFYVNNSKIDIGRTSLSISASDLAAAQSLVSTYMVILETPDTINEIIERAELDNYTTSQVTSMITATAVDETEIFKVSVRGSNSGDIYRIAATIGEVLPERISGIVDGADVRIVNRAIIGTSRVYPSHSSNTMIGFILGAFLSMLVIFVMEILNTAIRNEEYLTKTYDVPILAVVPNMEVKRDNNKYVSYYRSKEENKDDKLKK